MDSTSRGAWLTFPRALWVSLGVGLVLALPSVFLGFFNDDYYQLCLLEGASTLGSPFDLFHFAGGDSAALRRLIDEGPYPWWTLPELRLVFWRPLSSALAVLDHRLFGRAAVGWHLHSLLWYAGTVAVLGGLLRRVLPGALGALALLLYAVDGAHFLPVAWLANRNALVAAAPALLGLWMHLEWRESGSRRARLLSPLGFAVGLLGGESALGVFAYLLAYELLGARGSWRERLQALLPAGGLGLAYLLVYKWAGYGASGSGAYLDPLHEPGLFLRGALGRLPTLVGGAVLEAPTDLWALEERTRPGLVLVGLVGLLLLGGLLRATWPWLRPEERRPCGWLLTGAALSLLPVVATFPSQRLLLVPGVGGTVGVAAVLVGAWRARGERSWGLKSGAAVLGLAHLVLAPLYWPLMTWSIHQMNLQVEPSLVALEHELKAEQLPTQRVVAFSSPVSALGMYLPGILATRGMARPRAWWPVSLSTRPQVLTRTGERSLELALPGGHFLASEFESVFRGPNHPLPEGSRVELPGMTVTVLAADAEGPTRLGFTFDTPLEDPSLVFLSWREGAMHRMTPPAVGEHVPL